MTEFAPLEIAALGADPSYKVDLLHVQTVTLSREANRNSCKLI